MRLNANASNGDTDVYVNGRRLPRAELLALQQLVGPVRPGRYWLDPYGNAGGDGNCSYYNNPDGDSILIGDC